MTGSPTRRGGIGRRRWGWIVTVVGLLVLFIVGLTWARHRVETDLGADARQALDQAGYSDIDVAFSGRDATVSGSVSSAADAARIHDTVRGLTGVRHVADHFAETSGDATASSSTTAPPTTTATTVAPAATTTTSTTVPPTTTTTAAPAAAGTVLGEFVVYFDTRAAMPNDQSASTLDEAVAAAATAPAGTTALVVGFADSKGEIAANLALSQRRADSVAAALAAANPGLTIVTEARGETGDDTNLTASRRVEVTLTN